MQLERILPKLRRAGRVFPAGRKELDVGMSWIGPQYSDLRQCVDESV
jgi:hypothetical protein